ncbi:MAG TPA: hypothetical protein VK815_10405 [Candidatus Acidoferrales bacterium]|jgi:hypothetical protein|nr:hypothetical protein [Candidatus Acidoferrales bacterium]
MNVVDSGWLRVESWGRASAYAPLRRDGAVNRTLQTLRVGTTPGVRVHQWRSEARLAIAPATGVIGKHQRNSANFGENRQSPVCFGRGDSQAFPWFHTLFKKIKKTDEAQMILNSQTAGVGVPMAWGWQNEAKTKPRRAVARAINGFIKSVKCLGLRGDAEFLAHLRPGAMGRVKLQNEAIRLRQGYGATGRGNGAGGKLTRQANPAKSK